MPTVAPLRPADLDAWLDFFDHRAFSDNPEWGTCYCRAFRVAHGEDWDAACAAGANRQPMCEAIRAGQVGGTLAWEDGRVVGWVQHGPARAFTTPFGPLFPGLQEQADVGAVVCFVIAPEARGRGVARALLRGALDQLRAAGFREVVARAAPETDDGAHQFTGPLALYRAEGFEPDPRGAERRPWMRRGLGG